MACILDICPINVSIEGDGYGNVGLTDFDQNEIYPAWAHRQLDNSDKKRGYIEARVLITVAGSVAQKIRHPHHHRDIGDEKDHDRAREFIKPFSTSDDHRKVYLNSLRTEARDRLRARWTWVEAVAKALLARNHLSRAEILELVQATPLPTNCKEPPPRKFPVL